MLQPLQLADVSAHYAQDIADLRDFLLKSGLPVPSDKAVGSIVERLHADRTFHRDLTSNVWLLLDRADRHLSVSTLLGIIAVAAAGLHDASATDEDDAHSLLRFLMEARRSLETGDVPRTSAPAFANQAAPGTRAVPPESPDATLPGAPLRPRSVRAALPTQPQSYEPSRSRTRIAAAACVFAAVVAGLLLYRHSTVSPSKPASVAVATPGKVALPAAGNPAGNTELQPTEPFNPAATDTAHTPSPRNNNHATPSLATRPSPTPSIASVVRNEPASEPSTSIPETRRAAPSPTVADVPAPRPAAAPPLVAHALPRSTVPAAIPADILSKRLGARGLPQYASARDAEIASAPHYPRLLRRHPATVTDDAGLAADPQPAGTNGRPAPQNGRTLTPAGTVHPASLGMMAANVLYSPAPAYPVPASTAHVQGQVKVQAQIDRDGNVTYARVVSGPPLLRDAALDAVQHWRYRPYMSAGKPVPTSTLAVLDFELP